MTTNITPINTPTQGNIGSMHKFSLEDGEFLIFQLPRATNMLNEAYVKSARDQLSKLLPEGTTYMFVGCDVNVYSLAGADAVALKLKGLI